MRDKRGRTSLHSSAQFGDKNGLSALVERFSADIHAVDENKDTVLHLGTTNPKRAVEVTKYLLGRKVAVDAANNNKETPLHYAAKRAISDVVRILVEAGANGFAQSKNGDTPLHYAVQRSTPSVKIINILIHANANLQKITNTSGETALHCALRSKTSSEGYCALLKNAATSKTKNNEDVKAINIATGDGQTALHRAASRSWLQAVEILLKNKANVDAKDKIEWTPLLYAASSGDPFVLQILIDKAATVNSKAKDGTTALHLAAASGHHECGELLLERNAKVDEEDNMHRTPLWRAVSGNHERMVRLLLQHKANYNAKSYGRTLLHRAATLGYTSVARLLLDKGANKDAKDTNNASPLHQAIKQKNVVMIALLLDYDANTFESIQSRHKIESYKTKLARRDALVDHLVAISELEIASGKGNTNKIKEILLNKAIPDLVNSKNEMGNSCLISAVRSGQEAAVTLLVDDYHADLNIRATNNETPLHLAARLGHVKIALKLIDAKADINALNLFSRTPLHIAARSNKPEIAELLLACKGILINPLDKASNTPLLIATRIKNAQVAELLAANAEVDVEKPDLKGLTPMFWAETGNLKGVKSLLLERGEEVEYPSSEG